MKIELGTTAPEFTLYNSEKVKVKLSDHKGKKILLLFFPLAFSNVCTKELCSVRDNISFYNNIDAEIFGISVDSLYTLAKFKEDQHFNFTLLSDFNKEVSISYGTLYETFGYNMRDVGKRSAFIIDKEGVIRYSEVLENASDVPDFDSIKKCLEGLN